MKIRRNSFAYKVAYNSPWKLINEEKNTPSDTNLCRFFWRFVGSLFIVWPVQTVFLTVVLIFGLLFALFLLLSARTFGDHGNTVKIQRWPTIYGLRIQPWVVLLIGFLIWSLFTHTNTVQEYSAIAFGYFVRAVKVVGVMLLVVCVLIASFYLTDKLNNHLKQKLREGGYKDSVFEIVKAFVKAKKEKVCPRITFVEEPLVK